MERNSAAARHTWARQHAWLLLNLLPFPVGQTIYAPCTVWGGRFQKRFCKMFSESSRGSWTELQLPCFSSKQAELSENMLQNLRNNLPPQLVSCACDTLSVHRARVKANLLPIGPCHDKSTRKGKWREGTHLLSYGRPWDSQVTTDRKFDCS